MWQSDKKMLAFEYEFSFRYRQLHDTKWLCARPIKLKFEIQIWGVISIFKQSMKFYFAPLRNYTTKVLPIDFLYKTTSHLQHHFLGYKATSRLKFSIILEIGTIPQQIWKTIWWRLFFEIQSFEEMHAVKLMRTCLSQNVSRSFNACIPKKLH